MPPAKFKGAALQRLSLICLSILLAILLFWFLGFITKDISTLPGPALDKIEAKYIDPNLVDKRTELNEALGSVKEQIKNKQEQQAILQNGTSTLQNTINQLLTIQKQQGERNLQLTAEQQKALAESQTAFLDNQKQYLAVNSEIADLAASRHNLEKTLTAVEGQINSQRSLAKVEYDRLFSRHRWKVAALKLAVMLPLFLLAAWLFTTKRTGKYGPLVWPFFIAAFVQVALIVHEYFPSNYFKYIALLVIIAIVLKLMLYMLRRIISPKKDLLIKHYQEAYDKALCPVCSKPIRTGLLRFATGRRYQNLILAAQSGQVPEQQPYACPSCGSVLYEKCDKCGSVRHTLLPFCEHCGGEKTISGLT
jgi:predicted RNA-binding Zn-ribbon protein involved in translation (DUF1610 family)